MGTSAAKAKPALGFLTVVDYQDQGLIGGLLVLNLAGRPLEFHCTAPVRPNRAQQILYGPTLEPYLCGEQIAQTLLSKTTANLLAVCTDRSAVLNVREFVDLPVAMVLPVQNPLAESGQELRIDAPHVRGLAEPFFLGRNRLAVAAVAKQDQSAIADRLMESAGLLDLSEPFQRIRDAIEEARRGGQSG